jgi:hypothetical protein
MRSAALRLCAVMPSVMRSRSNAGSDDIGILVSSIGVEKLMPRIEPLIPLYISTFWPLLPM